MYLQWRIQDLTLRGRGLCQRGRGSKSLKVLMVEVKVIIFRVIGHISIKRSLKILSSEASEENFEKKIAFWA